MIAPRTASTVANHAGNRRNRSVLVANRAGVHARAAAMIAALVAASRRG